MHAALVFKAGSCVFVLADVEVVDEIVLDMNAASECDLS